MIKKMNEVFCFFLFLDQILCGSCQSFHLTAFTSW